MKLCILIVHDLTNDISYDTKLNRSKNCNFWGKIVKISWKKNEKWENICSINICWYIDIILHSGSSYIKLKYKLWFEAEWVQIFVILG